VARSLDDAVYKVARLEVADMEAAQGVASARTMWLLAAVAMGGALATGPAPTNGPQAPQSLRVKVIRSFAHDPQAFTQGLAFHAGRLYESTGLVGRSSLRRIDPATGAVLAQVPLEGSLFGEGLAVADGRLVQLTWTGGRALRWSVDRLSPEGEWRYAGEGWGLCSDGSQFVMSDGSDRLVRRDLRTFEATGSVGVRDPEGPVSHLNELECVGDAVYANVWQTSRIARIDARSGDVTAWIEAAGLLTRAQARQADVLNGIARLPSGRFVLTGKLWPRAFEVEFVPAP
jgi:glutamine cyclotransferase